MTSYTTLVNVTDGFAVGTIGDNLSTSQATGALGTTTTTILSGDNGDLILCDYAKLVIVSGGGSAWFRIPRNCRLKEFYVDADVLPTAGTVAVYLQPSAQDNGGQSNLTGSVNLNTTAARTNITFAPGQSLNIDNTGTFQCLRFDCAGITGPSTLYLFISYAIRSHA